MTPKLSIVTGALDRQESLGRLISSIESRAAVDWELVVSDASAVPYVSTDKRVRILHEKPRLGCTGGYNRAFRSCLGEWVLWVNDDVEVLSGFDQNAIEFMEAHPEIGLGALHYSEDGGDFHVNSAWGAIYANFGILRRELGEQVGWMDEDLEMYGCDNSLTFRVLLSEKGVADIPDARVIHHSVKDAHRIANQANRWEDNRKLTQTYMPMRRLWLPIYWRYRIDNGIQPWIHGVPPKIFQTQ